MCGILNLTDLTSASAAVDSSMMDRSSAKNFFIGANLFFAKLGRISASNTIIRGAMPVCPDKLVRKIAKSSLDAIKRYCRIDQSFASVLAR